MARVRGRGNKSTEEALARLFRKSGIKGWRRHLPLPGTPDFAFPKERLIIFVDGCFWHGCPKHATFPTTRRKFWLKKFADNKARDHRVNRILRKDGWRVLRIWEHELSKQRAACIRRIRATLVNSPCGRSQ
jgi:DNA mismatch endonuclease (patch repair protein)